MTVKFRGIFVSLALSFTSCMNCGSSPAPADLSVFGKEVAGLNKTNVKMSVIMYTNCFPAMAPILLRFVVENNTTNNIYFIKTDKLTPCQITVIGVNGQSIPKTRYGERVANRSRHGGGHSDRIPPGGHYSFTIPVNLLYDMSNVEEYTINAGTQVYLDENKPDRIIDLESGVLNVKVVAIDLFVETMWDEQYGRRDQPVE